MMIAMRTVPFVENSIGDGYRDYIDLATLLRIFMDFELSSEFV